MAKSYVMFNFIRNVYQVLLRRKDDIAPIFQNDAFRESSASINAEKEVTAEMQERSATVNELLQYVT